MSTSTLSLTAYCAKSEGTNHTFLLKEKVYENNQSSEKLVPFFVVTKEPVEFTPKSKYLLIGDAHTSIGETLYVFPFKFLEVPDEFDINQMSFMGRLGGDPKVRYTDRGSCTVSVSLAHDEYMNSTQYGGKGSTEKPVWTNILFLPRDGINKRGEAVAASCGKGDQLMVSGAIHLEAFTDEEGTQRIIPKLYANSISFISNRGGSGSSGAPRVAQPLNLATGIASQVVADMESIPF